jgi:hypothetical protein
MLIEELIVGYEYQVEAPNTSSREIWTLVKIKENGELEADGSKTNHRRTFLPEQFIKVHNTLQTKLDAEAKKAARAARKQEREREQEKMKESKEIQSTSVRLVGHVRGVEMWVEDITYMPFRKRPGRKTDG